ncbi:hypothetical protein KR044_009023, partial [Drosophila immigrans]
TYLTVLLLGLLASTDAALPFKKVSIAKAPAATTSTSTTTTAEVPPESPSEIDDIKSDNATLSKNSKLTGIPQIDYIWDPNLPRELRGFNLSSYPFLSTVPPMDEIHFKCEGLHDGFYASIEYKCQIYHHCVYGIRHDFLCANFTAFDQRTFICHFASDVDCEGSQKYWNRNDELYMATTTSSTSTTTTEAPATSPPRRRAQRPYHRPYHRRPVPDYYGDNDYDDDYYEDVLSHRNKPRARPRPRKPHLQPDYDDDYDDKPVEVKPTRRNRNRYKDEDDLSDEDYEEHRNRPGRRKPAPAAAGGRSKASPRKPGRVDERRSFNEDRADDEPRRAAGRRRVNEKRTTPSTADVLDELEEYEKPYGFDQEEAAEEQTPQKVKTTPKPLAEFITPKAAPASVYSRPRAPPRIARPVPINEKKKYSYPVQKNSAANAAADEPDDEAYYEEQEPEQQQHEDDYVEPPRTTPRRRTAAPRDQKQHPTRPTLRKPVTDKKALLDDQDYYSPETPRRKRPQVSRTRAPAAPTAADADFVDDVDYEEKTIPLRAQRVRPKASGPAARKPVQRPRQPIVQPEEEEQLEPANEEQPEEATLAATPARSRGNPTEEPLAPAAPAKSQRPASVRVVKRPFLPSRGGSPYLPRGLQPVGVAVRQQPVANDGAALRTTESTPIDMGSTISGVRLLEHGAPLLRGEQQSLTEDLSDVPPSTHAPRTTLPPRSALPTSVTPRRPEPPPLPAKLNLDELYENDYDVTLNDALDPTLKPLSPQHSKPHQHQPQPQHASFQGRPYASAYASPASESGIYNPFNSYQQASIYQNHSPSSHPIASALQSSSQPQPQSQSQSQLASYHSDSYFSSTDIRRRAIVTPQASRSHRHEYAAGGAVTNP